MANFRARARTVDMLGRQQIAGIPTAISELFKNAHDAYADYAEVDYFRADDLFVLRDDGIGMTEEEFTSRWLAIGTESKLGVGVGLEPPPKPKGTAERPMLGEKGIGRLAIAAIGPQVLILTRAVREDKEFDTVMSFINWGIFETAGVNLDEIDIPVITYTKGELPSREDVTAAVELFGENISKLGDKIKPRLAQRIRDELKKFKVDPRSVDSYLKQISKPTLTGSGKGTHFLILPTNESLIADIEGENNGDGPAAPITKTLIGFSNTMKSVPPPRLRTSFRNHNTPETYADLINPENFFIPEEFKTADHHFAGVFDEFGQFSGKVTIYQKEPIEHIVPWPDAKGMHTDCGPFKLDFAYVQGDPKESLLSQDDYVAITRKLNRIGGLYIYKDGIRVLPYGSSDYDFLELEQRRSKSAGRYYFSYRRMFGYIEISGGNNPDLNEKAGREGFRENKAFRQFRAILKNFFLQIAIDFFREGGEHYDAYSEGRAELKRLDAIRRAREQKVKEERRKFAATLDGFFEAVQSGVPEREAGRLLESVTDEVRAASSIDEPIQSSAALIDIEANARKSIDQLRERYKIAKPRGLGLTTSLRREWDICITEFGRLEAEIFQPTQQRIEALISDAARQPRSTVSSQKRVERALKDRITEARTAINNEVKETKRIVDDVRNQALHLISDSTANVENTINAARGELDRLKESTSEEAAILGEYYKLEAELSERTERERQSLESLRRQLQEVIDSTVGADEVIEALEEENLALRERSESDVELAQLGMAVSVISHEFENTVRSMRSNLLRLRGWADVNKELRDLYRRIISDFEHLDAYLQLFTPLERRLVRKKVGIRGSEIAKYLRELFADRFKREDVELQVTNSFSRMAITGYPATFYPVFVNLIDNSLFWLKNRNSPRIIKLDLINGDTFVVSDTGPGITKRDREAIFERGFTRKPGGRGMGLKISRDVLAREGWDLLLADSKSGEGATFLIKPNPQSRKGNNNP
jgi:signal transduction histidine kinase